MPVMHARFQMLYCYTLVLVPAALPCLGLEEAKDRCIEDYRCEVVCYHSKTGRTQYYQNFETLYSKFKSSNPTNQFV